MAWLVDRRTEELVRNLLKKDSRIDVSEIQVDVANGAIRLTGSVDSAWEKAAVNENLQNAGVNSIADELQLRNYVERTDDELRHSVRQALIRDIMVDARPISVEASKGIVTLSGLVESYAQKSAVEIVAWWTPGVTDVVSRLTVDGQTNPDEELE